MSIAIVAGRRVCGGLQMASLRTTSPDALQALSGIISPADLQRRS
jgi:hypothetical protein